MSVVVRVVRRASAVPSPEPAPSSAFGLVVSPLSSWRRTVGSVVTCVVAPIVVGAVVGGGLVRTVDGGVVGGVEGCVRPGVLAAAIDRGSADAGVMSAIPSATIEPATTSITATTALETSAPHRDLGARRPLAPP